MTSFEVVDEVFKRSKLKGSDRLILAAIATFVDANDECFPGLGTIAERAGLDRATVVRRMPHVLASGELVKVAEGGLNIGSNSYRFPRTWVQRAPRRRVHLGAARTSTVQGAPSQGASRIQSLGAGCASNQPLDQTKDQAKQPRTDSDFEEVPCPDCAALLRNERDGVHFWCSSCEQTYRRSA